MCYSHFYYNDCIPLSLVINAALPTDIYQYERFFPGMARCELDSDISLSNVIIKIRTAFHSICASNKALSGLDMNMRSRWLSANRIHQIQCPEMAELRLNSRNTTKYWSGDRY